MGTPKKEIIAKMRSDRKNKGLILFAVHVPPALKVKLNKVIEPYFVSKLKESKSHVELIRAWRSVPKDLRKSPKIEKAKLLREQVLNKNRE